MFNKQSNSSKMNRIVRFIIKNWSKTESDRLEIYKILHESTSEEYSEQTGYGNIFNATIEFLSQNNAVREASSEWMHEETEKRIMRDRIERNLIGAFYKTIDYIRDRKI